MDLLTLARELLPAAGIQDAEVRTMPGQPLALLVTKPCSVGFDRRELARLSEDEIVEALAVRWVATLRAEIGKVQQAYRERRHGARAGGQQD